MGRLAHRTAPGFTYFVSTKTWQNHAIFQVPEAAQIVIWCLAHYRDAGAYLLHEFVVMPDHLHVLLTPTKDVTLEKAVQLIKGRSSHDIHVRRGSHTPVWQVGFHEESVRNGTDSARKSEYIWMNPVRARLVDRPKDWPFGSIAGKFKLDPMPERLKDLASGAKAPQMRAAYVGAKAPTP
jgi:putative transposase